MSSCALLRQLDAFRLVLQVYRELSTQPHLILERETWYVANGRTKMEDAER